MRVISSFLLMGLLGIAWSSVQAASGVLPPPNVILIMTDDQGYGDIGCNGNTVIQTPHMDRLCAEGVMLDNYHVDPTCAPTRAALMTGRYSGRVGVWHTVQGRNMLREREVTMANVFADNGYATGLFGKWHLGDVYPYRPEDRGFQTAVYHKAGGVGQAPDYWGNDYFDDTYFRNGKPVRYEGFCTDVFFEQGINFIRTSVANEEPFFAYISLNAPHSPFYCPEAYTALYEGNPDVPRVEFYGMVSNIDDNLHRLRKELEQLKVADDTILIFTTDNGTAGGLYQNRGYNAGMRGSKGSPYEGGHRVPFILHWPNGELEAGKRVKPLTAHLDILPTCIDLCGLRAPEIDFDGTSLRPLLYGDGNGWKERVLVVESQRVVDPIKWRQCSVMMNDWRLVNGQELFNVATDPGQKKDVSAAYPAMKERLRAAYETFWADISREHAMTSYMRVGSTAAPVVTLSSHDWLVEQVPWYQPHIMHGAMAKPAHWAIEVEQAGTYGIALCRWPVESGLSIHDDGGYHAFAFEDAVLKVGQQEQRKTIQKGDKAVLFTVELEPGVTELAPLFIGGGKQATPYYVYITHEPSENWQSAASLGIPLYDPTHGRQPPQPLVQDVRSEWEPKRKR